MIRLVFVSGGKDSTACLLLALERHPREEVRAVFADTGNEHPATYDFVRYLGEQTGVEITWLRQDFTDWWWRRRDYVRDHWPEKGVSPEVVTRALALFDLGPSGNPYLDLCVIKGRFPARRMQFCTQFLKTEPLTEHALDLIDQFGAVESWQGVRAEESASRAKLPEREDCGGGYSIYRPILKWTAAQVFDLHIAKGIKPNPLYKQGMNRVGCMPCINVAKDELLEISKRFPEHIDRIAEWEDIVSQASKRANATFLPAPGDNETARQRGNIREMVRWSQTKRGGKLLDMFRINDEPATCTSAYGLCE
jgi:3'-phosphoadenosine 5'-phosphosulfate sulfotransferase (PAPS reductase)/FAD synthetase